MYEGIIPRETSKATSPIFAGLPSELAGLDDPAYKRVEFRRSQGDNIVNSALLQLTEGQETYIRGENGVLVTFSQLIRLIDVISDSGIERKGKSLDLVKMVSPKEADSILASAHRQVKRVHTDYQDKPRDELEALRPMYAENLDQVAIAFGLESSVEPQE